MERLPVDLSQYQAVLDEIDSMEDTRKPMTIEDVLEFLEEHDGGFDFLFLRDGSRTILRMWIYIKGRKFGGIDDRHHFEMTDDVRGPQAARLARVVRLAEKLRRDMSKGEE